MKGFSRDYTPNDPEIFLLVRIQLNRWQDLAEFEARGRELLPVFERETNLQLIASGQTDSSERVINFWRMRPEEFCEDQERAPAPEGGAAARPKNENRFARGGVRDLLPAMGRVHDIAEYGPVDDMIKLETQDLICEFSTTGRLGDPALPEVVIQPDEYYYFCLFEYGIDSGESGSLAFNLRAYLVNFEIETNWRCISTCFPMTGPLTRYIQLFAFASKNMGQALADEVSEIEKKMRWDRPTSRKVLTPTTYSPQPALVQAGTNATPAIARRAS
jgi:hypothetical protein